MNQHAAIGDYGIDAPPVIRNRIIVGVAAIFAGVGLNRFLTAVQPLTRFAGGSTSPLPQELPNGFP